MKKFVDLSEQEILALAISLEEEDERIYADFADALRDDFPATAALLSGMGAEETVHRQKLTDLCRKKFGGHIPLIRRQDVKGFVQRKPLWLVRPLGLEAVRRFTASMEYETRQFYEKAAARATDAEIRLLLDDLAQAERRHEVNAERLSREHLNSEAVDSEKATQRRLYALQVIQPGLAGLMDGSVSTLAPVFAAAAATQDTWQAFLVGLAASLGAGISMGFAEALSDDGSITGRGHPWVRGLVCGLMTTLGGIGHTLPFLIVNYHTALMAALAVVVLELASITWIRSRYMDTPVLSAALQVVLGGVLVFLTGLLIGNA
ncbi:rubrerythrin [Desulfovibrio desulfuricans]|uniref:Rubrerythrin n=1 Tax=Desulfovibrio desulfuricans TaxID=876 RepID=A0A4V1CXE1_DESDE|nr:ferritin family protein [Desulfovibrio desulfuricans]QCC85900.1 rubrerythrin [Desulfovibrio desulfuricans]